MASSRGVDLKTANCSRPSAVTKAADEEPYLLSSEAARDEMSTQISQLHLNAELRSSPRRAEDQDARPNTSARHVAAAVLR
mmetsp:Transcript_20468/g.61184  ORF Transcript_20468/g.61184 Transcript_20468/m.61184 type:complete len:81 (-) Transcript_20468:769-1011(-)